MGKKFLTIKLKKKDGSMDAYRKEYKAE